MATSASVVSIVDAAIVHEKPSPTADGLAVNNPGCTGIRVVAPSEYKQVALCLAEAFRDDHVVRYAIDTPDRAHWSEEQKYELYIQMFEYIVYASCLKGLVTTVGPNYDCCALWNPPGTCLDEFLTICQSGLWRLRYQFSREGRERWFNEFSPLLSQTFTRVMGTECANTWYLNYIGTKAGSRGRGYARKLIEFVTATADRDNQYVYLESSHDVNVLIYGKLGFELREPIFLKGSKEKIKMDIMVRVPVKPMLKKEKRVKKHFGMMGFKAN